MSAPKQTPTIDQAAGRVAGRIGHMLDGDNEITRTLEQLIRYSEQLSAGARGALACQLDELATRAARQAKRVRRPTHGSRVVIDPAVRVARPALPAKAATA